MDDIIKKHIVENGYGFDVYYNASGEEISRCGTGMTKEAKAKFDAELLFGILDAGYGEELLAAIKEVRAAK